MAASPPLDLSGLRTAVANLIRFEQIDHVESTGSTNRDLARAAATATRAAGRVLVSEHQSAGRGRLDRVWTAPPGASLAISVLVWPGREPEDWTWLPLVAGLAVLRGLRDSSAVGTRLEGRLSLKWPNDVLVEGTPDEGGGKVCGILTERVEGSLVGRPAAVIGIGINTAMGADDLPVPTATSLRLAGGRDDPTAAVAGVLSHLDELLSRWEERGHLREAYLAECSSVGRPLRVQVAEDTWVEGIGEDVDRHGRLVVRTASGLVPFAAGDVVHVR